MASFATGIKRHYLGAILIGGMACSVLIHLALVKAFGAASLLAAAQGLRSDVYPLLVSVSGTLLGFTVAGVSIILGLSKEPVLELLRERGLLREIHRSFFSTIHWLALLTVTAIAFVGLQNRLPMASLLILNVLVVQAILRLGVSYWILRKTLNIVAAPD